MRLGLSATDRVLDKGVILTQMQYNNQHTEITK